MDYKCGISDMNYSIGGNLKQYKINFEAIKSMDDVLKILESMQMVIYVYDDKNLPIKNNPHLFKEIERWIQKN